MAKRQKRMEMQTYDLKVLILKPRLSIDEAAFLLNVAPRSVDRYMTEGKLAFTRTPGGHRKPLTESVRKYL